MGIQIKGQNDNITSTDGSLEITGITTFNTQLDIGTVVKLGSAGIVTASNFKTGISNLHDVGLTLTGGQLDVGSNIKIGSAGVVTATSFVGNLIGNISGDFSVDDKIIHTGDTNTAIRFPAVDTFTVETNNTERFRIGSNGYIGVGNFSSKSRTDPLNVDSGIGTCNIGGNYIHLKRYSGGATQYINAPENNANLHISADDFIAFGVDHSSSMYSMGTEALRITSAGNVTVGGHTAALSTYNSSQPRLSIYKSSGSGGYLELGGNIPHNGHSSGTILFINNNNSEATSNNANGKILAMQRVENVTSDTNAGDDMGGDLTFNIKPEAGSLTERLRIRSDGKVVIGTNYTGGTLSVTGNLITDDGTNGRITIQADGTSTNQILSTTTGFASYCNMKYQAADHIFLYGGNERFRITNNGKIGINNASPECRTGGIDSSSNDSTSGRVYTDLRGHSSLILRNPSTTQHSFTQLLFENGGGTSAATMLRHRLGPSRGAQQNFVGDLCLFRRTGNAGGSNADYRESIRWCGSSQQARQIWWTAGGNDTSDTSRLGWHHLSAQRDHPGTDAYSFFRLETGAASYARGGFGKYTVVWTTGHASGYGLQTGHFGYYMHHGNSRIYVNEHIIYRERYSNGSFYSWDDSPGMRIVNYTDSGGTNAAISFRCGGRRHSGGFDMGVEVGMFIDLYAPESANGDTNPRLYVAGNSESNLNGGGFGTPVSHAYCSFQSSNPNHSGQP